MKKSLSILVAGMLAMGLVSCTKKGTVTGQVLDPFTGKPVEHATVWVSNTPLQAKALDGSFSFVKVLPGKYTMNAGKNKYSKAQVNFEVTEKNLNLTQNIYIFSREDIEPGMYKASDAGAEKIPNQWLNWEATCKESLMGYRKKFADAKTKKDLVLPDPMKSGASINYLFYQAAAANEPITAKAFPLVDAKVADHKDCSGFDAKAKEVDGLFPDMAKGVELKSEYKSDNLSEVTGNLPSGKSVLVLFQGSKIVKAYYFDAK